jgi:hypothetical protein
MDDFNKGFSEYAAVRLKSLITSDSGRISITLNSRLLAFVESLALQTGETKSNVISACLEFVQTHLQSEWMSGVDPNYAEYLAHLEFEEASAKAQSPEALAKVHFEMGN